MDLTKYLAADSIIIENQPLEKKELLRKLCNVLQASPALRDEPKERFDEVIAAILEREDVAPTGIGGGFAFPHARLKFLRRPAVALAVLKHSIDFDAPDGTPANIICLVAAPQSSPTITLKVMSQFNRVFAEPETRRKLESATNGQTVFNLLDNLSIPLDVAITARDIMRDPFLEIHPELPLRQVTALMSQHQMGAVAVVDKDKRLAGHITCSRILNYGLPDFFGQLRSVSFIRDFDPFEKYFFEEAHSKAKDLMASDFMAVAPDATLLEIVFALTALRQPKIYVVEEGVLRGEIDQSALLDQIINF